MDFECADDGKYGALPKPELPPVSEELGIDVSDFFEYFVISVAWFEDLTFWFNGKSITKILLFTLSCHTLVSYIVWVNWLK